MKFSERQGKKGNDFHLPNNGITRKLLEKYKPNKNLIPLDIGIRIKTKERAV